MTTTWAKHHHGKTGFRERTPIDEALVRRFEARRVVLPKRNADGTTEPVPSALPGIRRNDFPHVRNFRYSAKERNMQIKKVVCSMGLTVNLENYESARFDMSAEAEIDPDTNIDDQVFELQWQVRTDLMAVMADTLADVSPQKLAQIERRLGLGPNGDAEEAQVEDAAAQRHPF